VPAVPLPDPVLIVDPDDIARRAGLTRPMDSDTQWAVEHAIIDAQADVEAYLGQPITPTETTESGLYPANGGSLTAATTWLLTYAPVVEVVSATAEGVDPWPYGTYTVVYRYGLDAANDPRLGPIRRWVTAAVLSSDAVVGAYEQQNPTTSRVVTSLSAEGQSVSYGATSSPGATTGGEPGSGVPGSVPTLASLDQWRVAGRRVFQRRTPVVFDSYRYYA
jgi:hypothetical protein